MDILNAWLEDLPQQFQGKEFIDGLISAFAKQLEEIQSVFDELDLQTDLDSAIGKNLDNVGTIVNLTRKDAGLLLKKINPNEIDDNMYRAALKYKVLKNTCECTYYDIVNSIRYLWGVDYLVYTEPENRPATILIKMPLFDAENSDPAAARILVFKPAGVAFFYHIGYLAVMECFQGEDVCVPRLDLKYAIPFFDVRLFDGTWYPGGSNLLDAARVNLKIGLNLNMKIESNSETIENTIVETSKNLWTFDGLFMLDGTKTLNAAYRREEI